jgi:hypothetical protein
MIDISDTRRKYEAAYRIHFKHLDPKHENAYTDHYVNWLYRTITHNNNLLIDLAEELAKANQKIKEVPNVLTKTF